MKPAAGRARRGTANREVPSAPPPGAAQPLWPTEAQGPALHALAVCASLLLAVAIVFGRTVRYQFVNFDDCQYVYHNKHVLDGLTRSGIAWAFSHFYASNWHPLTWISHMLDCQFYGLWPGGHHLTNVLLHAVTAVLLFLVLRQMTGRLWPAALAAAIFALHPLRVESVAWVAERKDVLERIVFRARPLGLCRLCRPALLAGALRPGGAAVRPGTDGQADPGDVAGALGAAGLLAAGAIGQFQSRSVGPWY